MRSKRVKTGTPITERGNPSSVALDTKPVTEILRIINREDHLVAPAVKKAIPQIARAVDLAVAALERGGRLIYLGAGTSGRLGVLDAAECLPTFGTDRVIGVLAGAPRAMFKSVEGTEDEPARAARDLKKIKLTRHDILVGVAASGRTPYTLAGLRYARRLGAATVAITCNPGAPMNALVEVAIVPLVGPEVIAGSTRMKAGTAQKLILNMISTAAMTRLGRVFSHWMVGAGTSMSKLRRRGIGILMNVAGVSRPRAARALREAGGKLHVALLMLLLGISRTEAEKRLRSDSNIAALIRESGSHGQSFCD